MIWAGPELIRPKWARPRRGKWPLERDFVVQIRSARRGVIALPAAAEIITKGRHDPCVGIRAVPVGEAMMACVILDHILLHRGQIGGAVGETRGHIG